MGLDQFLKAFRLAKVDMDSKNIEYLYNAFSEYFAEAASTDVSQESRAISVTYFLSKLFSEKELAEMQEIDRILVALKGALDADLSGHATLKKQ